jgi:hypothetical protein
MNTNRDASAHTRKLAARTITIDHLTNPVRRGLNTDMAASYLIKIQLGPADGFLKPIYEERILGVAVVPVSEPAPEPAPEPEPEPAPIGPSGATPEQLLVNSGFTNGTTGWTSSSGFQTTPFDFESGTQPIVVQTINDNGITGSDGYLIFSFTLATVSQTVSITDIANYNIITGVLNLTQIPNNSGRGIDSFSYQIVYKNASNGIVATKQTPASGRQSAPTSFTDYTLTFTRDDSAAFDTIVSATVSFSGIDQGSWRGQHGPAVDYCTLTLS